EPHALRVEPGDRPGEDPGAPCVDGLDQVAIGDEAEPLLPRAIGRFEQRRIVTDAEFALEAPAQVGSDLRWLAARAVEEGVGDPYVDEADQPVAALFAEPAANAPGPGVARRV